MTFDECSKHRDEIAARVLAIQTKWDQERTLDHPAIQELRSYCKRIAPNLTAMVREVAWQDFPDRRSCFGRSIKSISALLRTLSGIDLAILHHRPQNPSA